MAEEFVLNQVASEVQRAINNALNPDTTLTESGRPADAKAVGDALENISGGGLSSTEKELILSLFKNAAYTTNMSATIAQLETLWSGSDVPDEPVVPDLPDADVSQTGNILSIVSGVTVSQSGSVLAIA